MLSLKYQESFLKHEKRISIYLHTKKKAYIDQENYSSINSDNMKTISAYVWEDINSLTLSINWRT